jgi:hypothetical protein
MPPERQDAGLVDAGGRRGDSAGGAGRAGLGAAAGGLACFLITALLGPSAEEPGLRGSGPPFALSVHPAPGLVIGLVAVGILLSATGLGLCFYAVARGWRCSAKPLLVAGLLAAAAFTLLPPVGSADHLNYAAYGRMVVLGHDPYVSHANAFRHDPVIGAVQEWTNTPSVYGPIVSGQEAFAAWVGGTSVRLTVFVLSVTNTLAFVLTGLLLYRRARDQADRAAGRLRSVLLWTCNPLLLFHLVSGAHNDALGIAAAVAALTVFRSSSVGGTLAAGALTGVAVAIKLPAALVGGGPAWVLRRRPVHLVALFGAAGAVTLAGYAVAGSNAFGQVRKAAKMVSLSSPWHLVDATFGLAGHRGVIQAGSLLLMLGLLWLLSRALPRGLSSDGDEAEAVRMAAALVLAWLFAAQYALPWYDALGWAALAMLPWSGLDWLLLARTTVLSLGYLPARRADVIHLPGSLRWLERDVRPNVIPWLLTAILAALVLVCLRRAYGGFPRPRRGAAARSAGG